MARGMALNCAKAADHSSDGDYGTWFGGLTLFVMLVIDRGARQA